MRALKRKPWTEEEYLAFERTSLEKHELLNGEVYLTSGASHQHNLITVNIVASLGNQLRDQPSEAYASMMRVRAPWNNYFYPDIVAVWDKPTFEDAETDTLLNPSLIIEVLCPSTEAFDRGEKFSSYRQLESLQEYVLIAQDKPHIEHFIRQSDGNWLFSEVTAIESTIQLASIDCWLALTDVYAKVSFDDG